MTIEREVYKRVSGEVGTIEPENGTMGAEIGTMKGETGTIATEIDTMDWREEISAKKDLQKRQIALLLQLMEEVTADGGASYSDLAKRTGKARSTVQQYMLYLSDHGFIKRVGGNKDGHWEIG